MNFDLRPHANVETRVAQIDAGLAQKGFLNTDDFENCTFAAMASTMMDYLRQGGVANVVPMLPEDMRNDPQGTPGFHGGEGWEVGRRVVQAHPERYPNPPPMSIYLPADPVADIRMYGGQGYLVHIGMWCTRNAEYTAGNFNNGISHAARAIAADSTSITFWNPWRGTLDVLTDDFVKRAYDQGGILVFMRSLVVSTTIIASGGLTVAGFVLHGVTHTFDLLKDGNIGWARTGGGSGGLLHQDFADINGPNGARDFAVWVENFQGQDRIVIKARMFDGSARVKVIDPDQPDFTKATIMEWSTPEHQGPGTFPVVQVDGMKA